MGKRVSTMGTMHVLMRPGTRIYFLMQMQDNSSSTHGDSVLILCCWHTSTTKQIPTPELSLTNSTHAWCCALLPTSKACSANTRYTHPSHPGTKGIPNL